MQVVSDDSEAFGQQLPFYQIRFLYNAAVLVFAKIGINIFVATHLISALSAVAGTWLIFLAFRRHMDTFFLYLLPLFAVQFGLLDVAKYSTPDGLAFLMVSLVVYLFVRSHWAILIILPVCVLVRTDLIIFTSLVAICLLIFIRSWALATVFSLAASIAAYLFVNRHYGNYGLITTYYVTFVQALTHPASATVDFGWLDYLRVLKSGVREALRNSAFVLFSGATLLAVYLTFRDRKSIDLRNALAKKMVAVLIFSLVYVALHFVIFPDIEERFFVGQYTCGLAVLFLLLSKGVRSSEEKGVGP
jgi:hypothetical protein